MARGFRFKVGRGRRAEGSGGEYRERRPEVWIAGRRAVPSKLLARQRIRICGLEIGSVFLELPWLGLEIVWQPFSFPTNGVGLPVKFESRASLDIEGQGAEDDYQGGSDGDDATPESKMLFQTEPTSWTGGLASANQTRTPNGAPSSG